MENLGFMANSRYTGFREIAMYWIDSVYDLLL